LAREAAGLARTVVASLLLAALLLAGFGPAAVSAELPRRGGAAVVAVAGDPGHLNPAISTAGPLHAVAGSLYNGLVALDRDGAPRPDLAERWVIAPDGLSVTFHLARGVLWHDGQPFTARDVVFTFENALFRLHARARAGLAPAVAAIEALDDHTVVFRLRRPHPALLRQLDVTEAPILAAHVYAGGDVATHPANLKPIGTGPYRFESYRRDDQVVLVRHKRYFKPGLPYLDRLVFRIIPDATTQVNALLAGEIDMLARVSALDAQRLRGQPVRVFDTKAAAGGSNCTMMLGFNLDRPATGALPLRRAFAHAIDRAQLLKLVAFGQGRVAAAPIHSGIGWAHEPTALAALTLNSAKAQRLLDEAGFVRGADGVRLTLDIAHFPAFARYVEQMRQQLQPVGIQLRSRAMDAAALAQTVFAQRDFDLTLISYCNGTDPEIGVRRMVDSAQIGPTPFSNAAGFRDAEVDRLFAEAGAATDEARRGAAYRAAQKRLAESLPYLWLVETDFSAAWRTTHADFAPWTGQFAEAAWRRQP
jgi:peptide/nickel transport system substrate-binding protein